MGLASFFDSTAWGSCLEDCVVVRQLAVYYWVTNQSPCGRPRENTGTTLEGAWGGHEEEGVVPESPARVPAAPPRYAALCRTYTLFLIPGMHPSSLTLTPGNDVSHFEVAYYSSGSSRISPRFKISSFMQPLVSLRIQCFQQYIQEGRGDETKEKKRRRRK